MILVCVLRKKWKSHLRGEGEGGGGGGHVDITALSQRTNNPYIDSCQTSLQRKTSNSLYRPLSFPRVAVV